MGVVNMKKKKWSTTKEMLFLYLAISKIFYWFNTIMQFSTDGFSSVGPHLFGRLLTQDLLIIFSILFFYYLDKFKIKELTKYFIAYVVFLAVVFAQIFILTQLFGPVQLEDSGMSGFLVSVGYLGFFIYFTLGFVTIAIVLGIKEYLKTQAKETTHNTGLAMNDFSNALVCETCKDELRERLNMFGQFVGEWDFEGIIAKGTPNEQRAPGEWIFSWILNGTAIQDVFICPSRKECEKNTSLNGEYGTTIRFYNQAIDSWDMFYGLSGTTHILEGKQVGEQIIVNNKSETDGLTQWVFSDITPTSFHWQNRTSYDNGITWNVNFELFATRKAVE